MPELTHERGQTRMARNEEKAGLFLSASASHYFSSYCEPSVPTYSYPPLNVKTTLLSLSD